MNFKVSWKVFRTLDKYINQAVKKGEKKADLPDNELWIILDAKRIKKMSIGKKLTFGRKTSKVIVTLPFEPLNKSDNFLVDFVALVCDAVIEVLSSYGIPSSYLKK